MCVHMCLDMRSYYGTCVHTQAYVCTHVYTHMPIHMSIHTCLYTCMYTCLHTGPMHMRVPHMCALRLCDDQRYPQTTRWGRPKARGGPKVRGGPKARGRPKARGGPKANGGPKVRGQAQGKSGGTCRRPDESHCGRGPETTHSDDHDDRRQAPARPCFFPPQSTTPDLFLPNQPRSTCALGLSPINPGRHVGARTPACRPVCRHAMGRVLGKLRVFEAAMFCF